MKKQSHKQTEDTAPAVSTDRSWWQRLHWQRLVSIGSTSLAVLAGVWLVGDLSTATFTLGHNQLQGRASDASLQQTIQRDAANYRLAISYPDGSTKSYALTDAGMRVDAAATIKAMRAKQHGWAHTLAWWQPMIVPLHITTDPAAQTAFIARHVSIVTVPAQNANLSINDGTVQVTGGANGKQYGLDNAAKTLLDTITSMRTGPLVLHMTTLPPTQNDTSLTNLKTQLNSVLNQHITITAGSQAVTPNSKDIGSWIVINQGSGNPSFSVDAGKVKDYLANLASSHYQAPQSRIVLSSTGQVIQNGTKGQTVTASQSAIDSLVSSLPQAKGAQVTLPVQYTSYQTVNAPTSGKWIEVNLSTLRMYTYDQGQLVRTFLVSAGATGTPTITGSFAIYAKYASQDMYGSNLNGTRYYQPAVPWVNYFYRDYAIHGNYWRPSYYFGNVNSSHGCVGVPVSDGAWIYSWAPIGTPVIVHY